MTTGVIFDLLPTLGSGFIGHIRLNRPNVLNTLNLEMVLEITRYLEKWKHDPNVLTVFMDANSDKAFCAGGDVAALYYAILEIEEQARKSENTLQRFFTFEYQLDYLIHTYPKPFIVWTHGLVMGGGVGLMNGASHRIVTDTTCFSMPEISIGLYPDVGASYFLNLLAEGLGLFLGLTGAELTGTELLTVKLADYMFSGSDKGVFLSRLQHVNWSGNSANVVVSELCIALQIDQQNKMQANRLESYTTWISGLAKQQTTLAAVDYILNKHTDDQWLQKAQARLAKGSPISAHLIFNQLARTKGLSLIECFKLELGLSCQCGEFGEFKEGVRALLIDKDNQPIWQYPCVKDVPSAVVEWFFSNPWQDQTCHFTGRVSKG